MTFPSPLTPSHRRITFHGANQGPSTKDAENAGNNNELFATDEHRSTQIDEEKVTA